MNTDCGKCVFANNNDAKCYFNITNLIEKDKDISLRNGYPYIKDYKCSYAFAKTIYEENKENLPEDISELAKLVRSQNSLSFYIIIDATEKSKNDICNILSDYIYELNVKPSKISIITKLESQDLKECIEYYKNIRDLTWKIHNLTSDMSDHDKLYDILNVNTTNGQILYVKYKSLSSLHEDLNYINYLSNVKKPNYAGIKKSDFDLDGLCISSKYLKEFKFNLGDKYMEFLSKPSELIEYYYEQ